MNFENFGIAEFLGVVLIAPIFYFLIICVLKGIGDIVDFFMLTNRRFK